MNNLPIYTKADLRNAAGTTIFARAEEYYEGGMVNELVRRGDTLYAAVEGSQDEPYQVTIHFTGGQIGTTDCTCWLRDVHLAQGNTDRALPAAIRALAEQPNMADYEQLQELAGDNWLTVRNQALSALRGKRNPYGDNLEQAEIFLREELWDDAIKAIDRDYGAPGLEVVMRALYHHRPDWVIRRASKFAEGIMDAGRSQSYDTAVGWLAHAKAAYLAAERRNEWLSYLGQIRARHERKHKLMRLLKQL